MELSRARIQTAYNRAVKRGGGDISHDCPKFRALFSEELRTVVVEDLLRSSDAVEHVGIADDGVLLWSAMPVAA